MWSEYSACRSSAQFRPEALEDFDKAFCLAHEERCAAAQRWIDAFREGGQATDTFPEIQQAFGDAFICVGYLLGHLHGLEMHDTQEAPGARNLLSESRPVAELIRRLGRMLHELWLSEFPWGSIEVFAPIYDLICEMMALQGMAFARNGSEWRIVKSDEPIKTPVLKDFFYLKRKSLGLSRQSLTDCDTMKVQKALS